MKSLSAGFWGAVGAILGILFLCGVCCAVTVGGCGVCATQVEHELEQIEDSLKTWE